VANQRELKREVVIMCTQGVVRVAIWVVFLQLMGCTKVNENYCKSGFMECSNKKETYCNEATAQCNFKKMTD
jgi:hypothetical protein